MKIRWKIFVPVIATTTITLIMVIFLIINNFQDYALDKTKQLVGVHSEQIANKVQNQLGTELSIMKTLSQIFSEYNKIPYQQRKPIYEDIMLTILKRNPQYNSVWVSWNMSVIDKNWHKPYGRQRTVMLKKADASISMYIDSADLKKEHYQSLYYSLKTSRDKNYILDPYFFKYKEDEDLDTMLMTSIGSMIFENNVFRGLVGVDVTIDQLQQNADLKSGLPDASTFLISNNGTIVMFPNKFYVGKKIDKLFSDKNTSQIIIKKIQRAEKFSITTDKFYRQKKSFMAITPFTVGDSKPWAIAVVIPTNTVTKQVVANFGLVLIIAIVGIIILMILIFVVSANISKPILRTSDFLNQVGAGNTMLDADRAIKRHDEIGEMARALTVGFETLKSVIFFVRQIGEGKFNAEYKLKSKNDRIGNFLIATQDNLRKIQQDRENKDKEVTRRLWIQSGITKVGEILQKKYKDYKELTDVIIKFLVKYLEIPQSAIFVSEFEDEKIKHLKLTSSYAYQKVRTEDLTFELGESLVGRCALEKKIIAITDLPKSYTVISSGLGEETPGYLILLPLIYDEQVLGVLEITAFKILPTYKREFLEVIAERLAAEFQNIANDIKTALILKKLEEQTSQIIEKDAQAMQFFEKLEQTTDNLQQQEFRNKEIIKAIAQIVPVTIFNMKSEIIDLNEKELELLEGKREDYIGKKHAEVIPSNQEDDESLKYLWQNLRQGHFCKRERHILTENKEVWTEENFIPIKDNRGHFNQVINIGLDITERRKLQDQLDELKQ